MVGHILQVRDDVSRHVAARLFAVGESPGSIFGNGKFKSLAFRFPHQLDRAVILGTRTRSIPIHNGALNAATLHVGDLPGNLLGIIGAIADVAVMWVSKPGHVAGVNARLSSGIEESSNGQLAHMARWSVAPAAAIFCASAGVVAATAIDHVLLRNFAT